MPLIALLVFIRFWWVAPVFLVASLWLLWPMLVFPGNDAAVYLWWGFHPAVLVAGVTIVAIRAYLQHAQGKVEEAALQAAEQARRAEAARLERIEHPWSTYSGTPSYAHSASARMKR